MPIEFNLEISDLLAVLFSAFALYISLKNRKNNLRENIFNRQLDAIKSIYNSIVDVDNEIVDHAIESKSIEKSVEELYELYWEFLEIVDKNEIYLDEVQEDACLEFIKVFREFIEFTNENKTFSDKEVDKVSDAVMDFEEDIRDIFGIGTLSKENSKLANGIRDIRRVNSRLKTKRDLVND